MADKRCSKCEATKPVTEFYRRSENKGWLFSHCKECTRARADEYYRDNNEECRAMRRRYHFSSKEKRSPHKKAYYQSTKEERLAYGSAWAKANRPALRARDARRAAAEKRRIPAWADLAAIKKVYKECPEGYHVDHIIPLQGENVSGLHIAENLQYLTPEENLSKGNRHG